MLAEQSGQSSVEAAVLIPTAMLLLALLVQPVCMAYTRSVMEAAACGAARVLATAQGDDDLARRYAQRRLAAVPEVSVFHAGGKDDWDVSVSCSAGTATVEIRGHVRPLPLMDAIARAFVESDASGVVLTVRVEERVRPEWLGGDYDDWTSVWE